MPGHRRRRGREAAGEELYRIVCGSRSVYDDGLVELSLPYSLGWRRSRVHTRGGNSPLLELNQAVLRYRDFGGEQPSVTESRFPHNLSTLSTIFTLIPYTPLTLYIEINYNCLYNKLIKKQCASGNDAIKNAHFRFSSGLKTTFVFYHFI